MLSKHPLAFLAYCSIHICSSTYDGNSVAWHPFMFLTFVLPEPNNSQCSVCVYLYQGPQNARSGLQWNDLQYLVDLLLSNMPSTSPNV